MKRKFLSILFCTLIFAGCSNNNQANINNTSSNNNTAIEQNQNMKTENNLKSDEEQSKIMDDFNKLLENDTKELDVIKYVDENIKNLSIENASKLVLGIEQIQNKNMDKHIEKMINNAFQDAMHNEFGFEFSKDKIENMKDEDLKKYLTELINSGYKITMPEGDYYITQDYSMLKKYNEFVIDEIKSYIDIMAAESDNPSTADAAIMISWDELKNRILKCEDFLNTYPNSKVKDNVHSTYLFYLMDYICGNSNTPTFDFVNETLLDAVKKSYNTIDLNNENSRLSQIMKEYLPLLEKSNYKLNDELNNYRGNLFTQLQEELPKI